MNIMETRSAGKRQEENIRKYREFQMQLRFTSLAENRVASQQRIIRQDYVKRIILDILARRSRTIEKKSKRKEIEKKKRRSVRRSAINTVIKFIVVLANVLMRGP